MKSNASHPNVRRWFPPLIPLISFVCLASAAVASPPPSLPIVSGSKIWERGGHNAFTDLVYFGGRWLCCFREGTRHNREQGSIRVIASQDGQAWEPVGLLRSDSGVDLRDPKFAVTPDGRLMLVLGGSVLNGSSVVEKHSLVAFSSNGQDWSQPRRVLKPNHWLWRVSWSNGVAYGYAYLNHQGTRKGFLVESRDGIEWRYVTDLDIPYASEATLRVLDSGEMIILARMEPVPRAPRARIGTSMPPYKEWRWKEVPYSLGGPNFIVLPDGRWIAGTRLRNPDGRNPRTALAWMTRESFTPFLEFESAGDTSYPGLVWKDGRVWVSYYSSHERRASIYLAQLPLE